MKKQKNNGQASKKHPFRFNSKGQVVVETILMMVLSIGLFIKAGAILKEKNLLNYIVGNPWLQSRGMIECGVWGKSEEVCKAHPNQINRSVSRQL